MRGRLGIFVLLAMGLGLSSPANRVLGAYEYANPANQAASNPNLNIVAVQPNYAAGAPFIVPVGSSAILNDPFVIQQFDATKIVTPTNMTARLSEVVISLKYSFDIQIQMIFTTLPRPGKLPTAVVSGIGQLQLNLGNAAGQTLEYNVSGGPPGFMTAKTLTYNPNAAPNTPNTINVPHYTSPVMMISGSTAAMGYTDSSTLNLFTGKGVVLLPALATARSSYSITNGNGIGGISTTVSAALSLQYYYNLVTVPEPSSVMLMMLGIAGLGAVGVRNRRKAGTPVA